MKKLLLSLVCLMTLFAVRAEETVAASVAFTKDNQAKGVSSYVDSWNTNDGWNIVNFNNNNKGWDYIKCGRKNNASVATITTGTALTDAITKVVVTIDAVTANKVNSIKLFVSDNTSFTGAGISPDGEIAKGDLTFTITTPAANKYYQVKFDCASGTSNGLVQVSKVTYYYNSGSVEPDTREPAGLSFPEKSYTVAFDDEFDAPALTKATDAEATYESSDINVAIVDKTTGIVTIKGIGTTTITATTPETTEYHAGTASYTLVVTAPMVNVTLHKYVSSGQYFIACEKGVAKNYTGTKAYGYCFLDTEYVPASGALKCPEDYRFTLTETAKGYTIQGAEGGKFYGMDATHWNSFNFYDDADATGSNCYWDITIDADGNAKIANKGREGAYLSWKEFSGDYEICTTNQETGTIQLYSNSDFTGVNDIIADDANAPVEYYNLQGVRVANPESGLYIRVQGKKATKVLVK